LIDDNQTTYFVYFKTKESKRFMYKGEKKIHTSPFIILDVKNDNDQVTLLWNTITSLKDGNVENSDVKTSIRDILNIFPSLKGFINSSEFKWRIPSKDIIDSISKDPYYAYLYAEVVLKWENVPKEIIDSIIKESYYAYNYAKNVLKWENVPTDIITGISKNPHNANYYAKDVLKWENVPQVIYNALSDEQKKELKVML
jgi:hypothetical protein